MAAQEEAAALLQGESGFGQRVDLTTRIRQILVDYPEGTSILKELIQNAVRPVDSPDDVARDSSTPCRGVCRVCASHCTYLDARTDVPASHPQPTLQTRARVEPDGGWWAGRAGRAREVPSAAGAASPPRSIGIHAHMRHHSHVAQHGRSSCLGFSNTHRRAPATTRSQRVRESASVRLSYGSGWPTLMLGSRQTCGSVFRRTPTNDARTH